MALKNKNNIAGELDILNISLNSNSSMPMFGLGTVDPMHEIPKPKWVIGRLTNLLYRRTIYKINWLLGGFKLAFSVKSALESGYRLIDTSSSYNNGYFIRLGIKWSKVPRKELFIITRISNYEQWNKSVKESIDKSLKELDTDYLDLFMFHWPVPDALEKTWKDMEEVYKEGLVKSIGVANCHQHHLEKIEKISTITPAVNEFEIHPLMSQNELVEYCKTKGIVPMAYTPLGRMHPKIIKNKSLKEIARKYSKTEAQIVLRWHIQRGTPVIPRSTNEKNIKSNINIFDFVLAKFEMNEINNINENLRLRYDPDNSRFTKPKNYVEIK